MTAQRITMENNNQWKLSDYVLRDFNGLTEDMKEEKPWIRLCHGSVWIFIVKDIVELTPKNWDYLDRQKKRGGPYQRIWNRISQALFLFRIYLFWTIIGVSLASRKVREATVCIWLGLLIAFSLFCWYFIRHFALSGTASPCWCMDTDFVLVIAYCFYIKHQK